MRYLQILIKKIIAGIRSVVLSIGFSTQISWQASGVYFMLRIFLQIITATLPVILVFLSKEIIDLLTQSYAGYVENAFSKLLVLLALSVGIKLLETMINKLMELLTGIHQDMIGNYINLKTMDQTNRLDLSYFDSPKFHDEYLNAKNDSYALSVLAWSTINLISFFVQMVTAVIILTRLHWLFVVLLFLLSIPSVIIERSYTGRIYNWNRGRAVEERKMRYVMNVVTDRYFAKDVRMYGLYDRMLERYQKLWREWFMQKKEWSCKKAFRVMLFSVLPEIGILSVTIYVGILILERQLTIGDFGLYSAMAAQLSAGIWGTITVMTGIYENNLKISNYRRFLSWRPILLPGGTLKPSINPGIEFRNVSFHYPNSERYILKNVNFYIKPKEKIALVGVNGSGKTTMIKLILRFYDVTEGEILIDGRNIKDYDAQALRRIFGVMFQDFTSYAFSARDNITISDPSNAQGTDQPDNENQNEQLKKACQISGIEKMIAKWTNGLDTYLTKQFDDKGEELSGGEWQKIALARAFFHKAGIMVLDEPTAALDAEAEYKLFSQYTELFHERGAILISHRLSSVTLADRILVLENGKIIENGRHEDLIKKNGRYAYLFTLQAQRYRIPS